MNNGSQMCIICNQFADIKNTDLPVCSSCLNSQAQDLLKFEDQIDNIHQLDKQKQNDATSISEIIPNKLYLGNYIAAKNIEILKKYHITHILVCGDFLKQKFPKEFIYHQFMVQDSLTQSISQYFQESYDFIENSQIVFVHCAAGINRSPAFVCAYLMKKNKWSYEEAFEYVKERRPDINKQTNFAQQLLSYEY